MIETIIFDYGGVITATRRSRCFSAWASEEYGLDKMQVEQIFESGHFKQYMRGKIGPREFFSKFQGIGVAADISIMSRRLVACNAPVPAMKTLLENLASRYDLCLISDSTPELSQDVRRKFQHIFRVFIFSEEHGFIKDDQILYDIALEKISTFPDKCLYIDDRMEKLAYPGSRGVHGIHFKNVESLRSDFVSTYEMDHALLADYE